MPARRAPQQAANTSLAPFAFAAGVAAIGAGAWFGYPGVPGLWLALLISAWLEKPPLLTGRKIPGRGAQAADEREEGLVASYQMWRAVRWRLLVPTKDWWIGFPPFASWIAAVAAATATLSLPVLEPVYALANPPLMFVTVVVLTAAARRKSGSPGLRLNSFPLHPVALIAGAAGAAAGWFTGVRVPPILEKHWPVLDFTTPRSLAGSLAVLGLLAGLYPFWSKKALSKWRAVVRARREWRPRWEALRFEPLPELTDSNMVGDWQVDDFTATSVNGSSEMRDKAGKIATTVGGGVEVTVLTRPNEAGGNAIPGTIHPQKFAVVTAPSGAAPDLSDPKTPAEAVGLAIEVMMRRTCIALGLPPAVLTAVAPMHADGSAKALWKVTAEWPDGPGWAAARSGKLSKRASDGGSVKFGDRFMAISGIPAVVDHRTDGGCMFVGVVDDDIELSDQTIRPIVQMLAAEEQWRTRWELLKVDPAPDLYAVRTVGKWTVYDFEALGAESSATMRQRAPKIAPTVGAGLAMTLIPRPDQVDGADVPGTIHPRRFAIVTSPSGDTPAVGDPDTDRELVDLALTVWIQQVCDILKFAPAAVKSVDAVHTGESPVAMWKVRADWVEAPGGWLMARTSGMQGMIAGGSGLDAVIDHRTDGGHLLVGVASDELVTDDEKFDATFTQLSTEDWWNQVWGEMKADVNAPTYAHQVSATSDYQGKTIERAVFQIRKGMDPQQWATKGSEAKLGATLGPAPFVSVTGWTPPSAGRKATRHATAFCVTYSNATGLPSSPDKVVSAARPSPAQLWLLAAHMNTAFDAARLARPEVVSARALTPEPRNTRRFAEPSIWEITLRLYGGVTLADVRGHADRMRQALAVPWLRVDEAADGCVIYAGAKPGSVEIVSGRDRDKVISLDWDQAWLKSKIDIPGALTPVLKAIDPVATNPQVSILTFDLPQGASIPAIAKALPNLRTATGNDFVEIDRVKTTAARLVLQVSQDDPMPKNAPYDPAQVKTGSSSIPMAVDVAGIPDNWVIGESPHLGVIGGSGSGKSAAMAILLTGCLLAGHECVVIDPTKECADFKFAKDYCLGMAETHSEGAALIRWVYDEVVRRRKLNSKYGARSFAELPDDVRPDRLIVFIDEFTSLIEKTSVPKAPYDDPGLEEERQNTLLENLFRDTIGSGAGKISREARSAGVSLVLGGQKLRQDDLNKVPGGATLKVNLARLLLGTTTMGDRMSALRRGEEAPVFPGEIPIGRGIFEPSTGMPHTIQVCYQDPSGLTEVIAHHREVAVRPDLSKFMPVHKDTGPAVEDIDISDAWDDEPIDLGDVDFNEDLDIELDLSDFDEPGNGPETDHALADTDAAEVPGSPQQPTSEPGSEPPASDDDAWDVFGAGTTSLPEQDGAADDVDADADDPWALDVSAVSSPAADLETDDWEFDIGPVPAAPGPPGPWDFAVEPPRSRGGKPTSPTTGYDF